MVPHCVYVAMLRETNLKSRVLVAPFMLRYRHLALSDYIYRISILLFFLGDSWWYFPIAYCDCYNTFVILLLQYICN